MRENITIKFILLGLLLVASFLLSLFFAGSGNVFSDDSTAIYILKNIRVPKSLTAVAAGSSLALSGLVLQIIFRNPLAGPYVLGISSGASMMVAVSLLAAGSLSFFPGTAFTVSAAIMGSVTITLLILVISQKISNNVILLLIGLMISQICGAMESALAYFADPGKLKSFVLWGMGSLSATTNQDLLIFLPLTLVFTLGLFFYIKPLHAFLLGQDYAHSSGIDSQRKRFALILISSALTGLTTAFCGPVAFVGIAVPILSRMIFKTSRPLVHIISCILIGGIILLFSDVISHRAINGTALPINMITTLVGAPLVIYLMFKNKYW